MQYNQVPPQQPAYVPHNPLTNSMNPVQGEPKRKRVQVSAACMQCKRAHAACSNTRPCDRCVRINQAAACIAGAHASPATTHASTQDTSAYSNASPASTNAPSAYPQVQGKDLLLFSHPSPDAVSPPPYVQQQTAGSFIDHTNFNVPATSPVFVGDLSHGADVPPIIPSFNENDLSRFLFDEPAASDLTLNELNGCFESLESSNGGDSDPSSLASSTTSTPLFSTENPSPSQMYNATPSPSQHYCSSPSQSPSPSPSQSHTSHSHSQSPSPSQSHSHLHSQSLSPSQSSPSPSTLSSPSSETSQSPMPSPLFVRASVPGMMVPQRVMGPSAAHISASLPPQTPEAFDQQYQKQQHEKNMLLADELYKKQQLEKNNLMAQVQAHAHNTSHLNNTNNTNNTNSTNSINNNINNNVGLLPNHPLFQTVHPTPPPTGMMENMMSELLQQNKRMESMLLALNTEVKTLKQEVTQLRSEPGGAALMVNVTKTQNEKGPATAIWAVSDGGLVEHNLRFVQLLDLAEIPKGYKMQHFFGGPCSKAASERMNHHLENIKNAQPVTDYAVIERKRINGDVMRLMIVVNVVPTGEPVFITTMYEL